MHGSLPEPKVHVSKLASILIIVDLEGQAAKKEKKKKTGKRYSLLWLGKEFLGQKGRMEKNKNDSVPSGSFSSESVGRKLSK